MISIVLFEPEIPPNTGNIIRLAANTGARLHLVKPFGFTLDDRRMRRAGLDYHEFAGIEIHQDWAGFKAITAGQRVFGVSTRASQHYTEIHYQSGDFLVFGPESRGLPEAVRAELGASQLIRIPMQANSRSLNLANAAAVIVYEAWRQLGFIDGN